MSCSRRHRTASSSRSIPAPTPRQRSVQMPPASSFAPTTSSTRRSRTSKALAGMYEPVYAAVIDGHAEVRQVFKSSRLGGIAGCYVTDGTLRRGLNVRVMRAGQEIAKTRCEGLKRFQDDVR